MNRSAVGSDNQTASLMLRDEIGVFLRSRIGENARWCLASVAVAADVSVAAQHGGVEGRGAYAAAARAGGAAVRPALGRQRGLPARHRHGACVRLRPSRHPPHEERRGVHGQM